MDDPDYLIVNPLQIELILSDNSNHTHINTNTPIQQHNNINNEREITEIEKRFYDKMAHLKNISIRNKRLMYMIQNINHRLIMTDV